MRRLSGTFASLADQGWVGMGAEAFQAEMIDVLFPRSARSSRDLARRLGDHVWLVEFVEREPLAEVRLTFNRLLPNGNDEHQRLVMDGLLALIWNPDSRADLVFTGGGPADHTASAIEQAAQLHARAERVFRHRPGSPLDRRGEVRLRVAATPT